MAVLEATDIKRPSQRTILTEVDSADYLVFEDVTDSTLKAITKANLVETLGINANTASIATLNDDDTTEGSVLKAIKDTAEDAIFTPTGNIEATDIKGAIAELDTEKEKLSNKVSSFQPVPDDIHYPSEKLTKDELDALTARIDNIIASSGTSDTEVVDARFSGITGITYALLKNRLDAMETTERDNHRITIDGSVYTASLIIKDGYAGIRFTEVI